MARLGTDVCVGITMLGFDGETIVASRDSILLEMDREVPCEVQRVFIDCERVPLAGTMEARVVSRTDSMERRIAEWRKSIPSPGWYRKLLAIYNRGQKAIQVIPVVGKPLEQVAPDAFQRLQVVCTFKVDPSYLLNYEINVANIKSEDHPPLISIAGEFRLGAPRG